MARPLVKSLDHGALAGNCDYLQGVCGSARLMAVIKADAYGHGLVETARALGAADAFAVACVGEAVALREAGVAHRILVLQGGCDAREYALAREHRLALVVHREQQLAWSREAGGGVELWLKFDTGMHRLGFSPADHARIVPSVLELKGLPAPPVLMSHLACAEQADEAATRVQIEVFDELCSHYLGHGLLASLANSAAALRFPETHRDWVRAGIALYGAPPVNCGARHRTRLKPVMRLTAPVIALRDFATGDRIGYGGAYVCRKPMRAAIVAAGYGDGYPRHAESGTPVWLAGARRPLVGRVSMDMLTVDVSGADVQVGAVAELWGANLPVTEVAAHCNTIAYELLCASAAGSASLPYGKNCH